MSMSFMSSGPTDGAGRSGLGRRHSAVTQLPSKVRFLPLSARPSLHSKRTMKSVPARQARKYERVYVCVNTDELALPFGVPQFRGALACKHFEPQKPALIISYARHLVIIYFSHPKMFKCWKLERSIRHFYKYSD